LKAGVVKVDASVVDCLTRLVAQVAHVTKTIVLEDKIEITPALSYSDTIIYRCLPTLKSEQEAFSGLLSSAVYRELSGKVESLRDENSSEDFVRIPPFALQVFERAGTDADLGKVVLEMRNSHSKTRSYLTELDQTMRSPDIPLRQKLRDKAKLQKAINVLFAPLSTSQGVSLLTVSIAGGLNEALNPNELYNAIGSKGFNFDKIIGWLISKGEEAYWRFRLRPFHATSEKYLSHSNSDIGRIVTKHFSREISESDFQFERGFQKMASSLNAVVEQVFPPEPTLSHSVEGNEHRS